MKASVILSTYNGEKYIIEQLESIRLQTKSADEVIICDDCSKDNTVGIVNKYISDNNLNSWSVIKNEHNKGYIKNFLYGATLAHNEVIFFSDQDDIWEKNKIEYMMNVMEEKRAIAVYCLTDTIDSDGNKVKNYASKMCRVITKCKLRKVDLYEKIKYSISPGLCLAFNKDILNEIIEMSLKYDLPHDLPVGTIASIKKSYYVINKVLVHHRVHSNNVTSHNTKILSTCKDMKRQLDSREIKKKELLAINELYRNELSAYEKKELDKAIKVNDEIIKNLEDKKIFGIVKSIFLNCKMLNNKLAIRNALAVVYNKKNGENK